MSIKLESEITPGLYLLGLSQSIAFHIILALGGYLLWEKKLVNNFFLFCLVTAIAVVSTGMFFALLKYKEGMEHLCAAILEVNLQMQNNQKLENTQEDLNS